MPAGKVEFVTPPTPPPFAAASSGVEGLGDGGQKRIVSSVVVVHGVCC